MKLKILAGIAAIITGGFFIVSCDKVEEPFTKELTFDTTTTKTILLEDFTGHTCVNCPNAAILSHNLKNNLGDNLVVLAVHAGWFANATPGTDFSIKYSTDEGEEWNTEFGITSYPSGMVNRKGVTDSKHILSIGAWSAAILQALKEPAVLNLTVNNDYNSASRQLTTEVKTEFLETLNKDLKLVVVLTESGMVSPQKNDNEEIGATPIIYDYVHNHVMRAAINGTWGTALSSAGFEHDIISRTFTYNIPENFVAENCGVVAYVYDTETKEIYEAGEAAVTE